MHADQAAPPAAGPGPGAPPRAGLSLWRIVDVPFRTCVAALETWPHTGRDGWPVVCGPVEHDPDSGTCRVQARLARGPLRRALPMRLQADHWSSAPPRTALELMPCRPVRPSAAYFRAGHQLLDQLARSLARPWPAPDRAADRQPAARQEHDMPRFMDFHADLKLPAEALAQIADDTRHGRADQFGVRQVELYHNPAGPVYCLLEGPDEDAIRQHHAALGVPCGDVHQVTSLT